MNNKGELGVGIIITLAVAAIIGLVLLTSIASNVEHVTQASTGPKNSSQGLYTGVLNTKVELVGQELVTVEKVTNRTGGDVVAALNYTIAECIRSSDGLKGICYTALSAGSPIPATGPVNITYIYYPDGYADDAGTRAISGIIIILVAIGIAFVFLPALKDWY